MTLAEFAQLQWHFVIARQYVIQPPFFFSIIAAPSFCFPEQSPDGQWHLFAHSAFGIRHYYSQDGINWKNAGVIVSHASHPFLYFESGNYFCCTRSTRHFISLRLGVEWRNGICILKCAIPATSLNGALPASF